MPSFVDDLTSLDYPKSSLRTTPSGAVGYTLRSEDWNRICQAAVDLRTAVLSLRTTTNDLPIAQLAQIATATFLGRTTAGTGDVEILTATQATAMLNVATVALKGLVPAPVTSSGRALLDDLSWGAVAGGGTTTLAMVDTGSADSSAINLTTAGTIDWVAQMSSLKINQQGNPHTKALGPGWLRETQHWIMAGLALSLDTPGSGGIAMTSTAADDSSNTALASDTNRGRINGGTSTSNVGWGFMYRVPASTTEARLFTVRIGSFGCSTVTFTAKLLDNARTTVTGTVSPGANAGNNYKFSVSYLAATACDMIVTVTGAVASGTASSSISSHCAYISVAP